MPIRHVHNKDVVDGTDCSWTNDSDAFYLSVGTVRFLHWSTDSSEFVFCVPWKAVGQLRWDTSHIPFNTNVYVWCNWFYNVSGYCFLILNFPVVPPRCQKGGGVKQISARFARRIYPHFQKRGATPPLTDWRGLVCFAQMFRIRLVDVITCTKFYGNRLRGYGFSQTTPTRLRHRRSCTTVQP